MVASLLKNEFQTITNQKYKLSPCATNEEPWMRFLQSKFESRHGQADTCGKDKEPEKPILALPPGLEFEMPNHEAKTTTPALQTSEYLRLLKGNAAPKSQTHNKTAPWRKNQSTTKITTPDRKLDLLKALDDSINSHLASTTRSKNIGVALQGCFPRKGNNNESPQSLTQMIRRDAQAEFQNESQMVVCSQDDLWVERRNRDQDLSEEVYFSDDEGLEWSPKDSLRASAHVSRRKLNPRSYVMQNLDSTLDCSVAHLLSHLNEIQNRHRTLGVDSGKRRSLFLGIREVVRAIRNRRIKCVIIAPDILEQDSEGKHEDMIAQILRLSYDEDIPVVFALNRSRLGRSLGKLLRTSVIGILDAKGANDHLDTVLRLAYEQRVAWLAQQRQESRVSPSQLPPWRKVARAA